MLRDGSTYITHSDLTRGIDLGKQGSAGDILQIILMWRLSAYFELFLFFLLIFSISRGTAGGLGRFLSSSAAGLGLFIGDLPTYGNALY